MWNNNTERFLSFLSFVVWSIFMRNWFSIFGGEVNAIWNEWNWIIFVSNMTRQKKKKLNTKFFCVTIHFDAMERTLQTMKTLNMTKCTQEIHKAYEIVTNWIVSFTLFIFYFFQLNWKPYVYNATQHSRTYTDCLLLVDCSR